MKGIAEMSAHGSTELDKLLNAFPDKPWNADSLSGNPNITMKYVLTRPTNYWDWNQLSANSGMTINDVVEYPWKPWHWEWLSMNQSITMKDVTYMTICLGIGFG